MDEKKPLGGEQAGISFEELRALKEAHRREVEGLRRLLQDVVDCVPEPIFVKAPDHTYLLANKTCADLIGAAPGEFLGKKNADFWSAEVAAEFEAADTAILAGKKPVSFEENVPMRGNEVRVSMTTKTPFHDEEGRPLYVIGFSRDLTEQKRTEQALQRSHAELTETQTTLRETIRELSTPVLPIHDGVLVVPLVGHMDSQRSSQLTEALLSAIQRHRAAAVIIDITGVEMVDTAVASHLIQTARAASLLGAQCILVGIAPTIARTLVQIGVDFGTARTCRDLQAGVALALEILEGHEEE